MHTGEGSVVTLGRQRFENVVLKDGRDEATSQRMAAATRSWNRQGPNSPQEPLEGSQSC